MHLWTCNIPFANTEPPTGLDAIANEDTLFAERAGVEGLPDPEVLAKAWEQMRKHKMVTSIPRYSPRIRITCKQPEAHPKTLSRFLRHQANLVDGTKRASEYKFWMDLTCSIATVRLVGCWVQATSEEGKNTIFALVWDVLTQLNPKKDF